MIFQHHHCDIHATVDPEVTVSRRPAGGAECCDAAGRTTNATNATTATLESVRYAAAYRRCGGR
jgi:hypothetical protein